MRRIVSVIALLLVAAACGDNEDPKPAKDDAGVQQPLAACLDRPDELSRPPEGQLPCELLPPGFAP